MSVQVLNKKGKVLKVFTSVIDAYSYANTEHLEEFSVYTQLVK
jgi:hypothetical protein